MGLYDRQYTQEGYQGGSHYAPQMRLGLPQMTPYVKWLLIINIVVFFLQLIVKNIWGSRYPGYFDPLTRYFTVWPYSWIADLSLWRYVTYQFMHAGAFHIGFNMLALYFLGPVLERHWGSRRFLGFYLGCGIAGGMTYVFLASVHWLDIGPMLGASGAILGLLVACAILFPQFVVFIIIFPVPIRVAAVLFIFFALFMVLDKGTNAGGEAAHFGGMVAGGLYVLSQTYRDQLLYKFHHKRRHKQMASHYHLEQEVDRILQKVQRSGIHSLTSREKTMLKKATELEQRRQRLV